MAEKLQYELSLRDLFSKKMDNAIGKTSRLDKVMSKVKNNDMFKSMLGANLAYGAISRLGMAVSDFGIDTFRATGEAEQFHVALKTMLHGNSERAELLERRLFNLAKTTPFELTDVRGATRQMIAYGFETNNMIENMTMLGDVSAGVAAPIQDITYLYGTLKTQNKVLSRDIYQFANRGIPIIAELAKHFGVAEDSILKMTSKGQIHFKDVEKAFENMTSEGGIFFNMMKDQSKTLLGKTSNLADSFEMLKITIGESQKGILVGTVDWVTKMVTSFDNLLTNRDKLSKAFEKYGAEDYTTLQKIWSNFGITGAVSGFRAEDTKYQDTLNKMFVDKSADTLKEAQKSKLSLTNMIANVYKDMELRKDPTAFNRTIAILKSSLDAVNTNIATLKTEHGAAKAKATGAGFGLDKDKDKKIGAGTEGHGARPQNLNINIEKLIETMNLKAADLTESTLKIKEAVTKALLESLNDINTIAR